MRNFRIFFPDSEDSKVPLDEGKNEVTSTNCNLTAKHHFALESMNVRQYVEGKFRKCIKVNRTSKDVDLEKAMYCYMFKLRFFNGVAEPLESLVHITSEKNAYGAVYEMWYNGEVEQYRITMGPELLQRKLPLRVPTVALPSSELSLRKSYVEGQRYDNKLI